MLTYTLLNNCEFTANFTFLCISSQSQFISRNPALVLIYFFLIRAINRLVPLAKTSLIVHSATKWHVIQRQPSFKYVPTLTNFLWQVFLETRVVSNLLLAIKNVCGDATKLFIETDESGRQMLLRIFMFLNYLVYTGKLLILMDWIIIIYF